MTEKYSLVNTPYAVLFNILKYKSVEEIVENFDSNEPKLVKLFNDPRYWLQNMGSFFVQNKPTFMSYKEWYDIITRDIPQNFVGLDNKFLYALAILYPDHQLLNDPDFWIDRFGPLLIDLKPINYSFIEWLEIVVGNNLLKDPIEDLYYGCENGIMSLVKNVLLSEIDVNKIQNGLILANKFGHDEISEYLNDVLN